MTRHRLLLHLLIVVLALAAMAAPAYRYLWPARYVLGASVTVTLIVLVAIVIARLLIPRH